MGGEKHQSFTLLLRHRGSPPHGRGKGRRRCRTGDGFGITPAWAGKRYHPRVGLQGHRDHPRMGGEKGSYRWVIKSVKGSPPRGRGKGGAGVLILGQIGITPAWAGKRLLELRRKTGVRDHPRVGGEKHLSGTTDNRPQGSPPRGRGKDVLPCGKVNSSRITPARAGKKCISA